MYGYVTVDYKGDDVMCQCVILSQIFGWLMPSLHSKWSNESRVHNQIWAYSIVSGLVLMWIHEVADSALSIHFKATACT